MRIRTLAVASTAALALVLPAITPAAHAVPTVHFTETSAGFAPPAAVATTSSDVVVTNADVSVAPAGSHTYTIGAKSIQVAFGMSGVISQPFTAAGTYTLSSNSGRTATIIVAA